MVNRNTILLAGLLALATVPVSAQCGPSHSGHSGHGEHGAAGHAGHQDNGPKVTATNTLCPVMGEAVKPGRDREVVIGGLTYLVCCDGCGPKMAEHPEKYLDKDGKPLNAPKDDEAKRVPVAPASPHEGHQH